MSFNPITNLKLLSNIDLDSSYANTFTFASELNQSNFFKSKTIFNFDDFTFLRKQNQIKIRGNVESYWNCSYLMFQNKNFGNKWFYAFVEDLEYVNDNCTLITFKIDVMQTWYFEFQLKNSFVEREHVNDDTIGANTVAEGLELGEFVINNGQTDISSLFSDYNDRLPNTDTIVFSVAKKDDTEIPHGKFDGVITPYRVLRFTSKETLGNYIKLLNDAGFIDTILAMFQMPSVFVKTIPPVSDTVVYHESYIQNSPVIEISKQSSLDGYIPKNNKLLCFPFNFLEIGNNNGGSNVYHYELWKGTAANLCRFSIEAILNQNPIITISPNQYRNVGTSPIDYDIINEESVRLSNYDLIGWDKNSYSVFMAQNKLNFMSNSFEGAVTAAAAAVEGDFSTAAKSALDATFGNIKQIHGAKFTPNVALGNTSGASFPQRMKTFNYYQKSVKAELARKIDDYFSCFGYKINELKVPNYYGRQNWNYVKCGLCNVYGNLPKKDLGEIKSIFERGVTFWHSDNVGNYNLSNNIV